MITGDDILIEYVERLCKYLSTNFTEPEVQLNDNNILKIEKFVTHYVWHCNDKKSGAGGG